MNSPTSTVFVVDDDEHVRNALCRLLRSGGYAVQGYASASAFVEGADLAAAPACLLLDLQLPDLSGIELQRRLAGIVPIVFVSAHGDMNTAVEAMKAGATDFLTKPIDACVLFEATSRALERACRLFAQREQRAEIERRLRKLTPREREVMALVVTGRPNKLVADELGAAEKTIKIHRARVMEKMKANSLADLVRLVTTFDFDVSEPLSPQPSRTLGMQPRAEPRPVPHTG
ncbi:response regulator transcription factor [Paraburkholderia lycopersici]|uniref:Two-component response regulator, FixJ family, consists of REC and HTH domains n=1 Tax=Paraburkholderia lycopersici TaxID=416944 RepID=A0A1G6HG78_9BURK|nr:response regulator [Paraburkholderia lycopersici]SDB93242.1 Two-component response regulator, FixJ family, consists of REC and HTH domains [Paraburkholderia lycopersici]